EGGTAASSRGQKFPALSIPTGKEQRSSHCGVVSSGTGGALHLASNRSVAMRYSFSSRSKTTVCQAFQLSSLGRCSRKIPVLPPQLCTPSTLKCESLLATWSPQLVPCSKAERFAM